MPDYFFWENGNVGPVNFEPGLTESINQVAHGFELPPYGFIPAYDNAGTWAMAIGSSASTYQMGVILEITDADNFVIQRRGYANIPKHGLAIGRDYYISDDDAGEISYAPTTNLVKSITPVNSSYIYIQNTGYPRVKNGLNVDTQTGQIKLGGSLTEDTFVGDFVPTNYLAFGVTGLDILSLSAPIQLISDDDIELQSDIDVNIFSGGNIGLESDVDIEIITNAGSTGDINIQNVNGGLITLRNGGDIVIDGDTVFISEATQGAGTASNGDVLTLIDDTTGEAEWAAPTGASSPLTTKGDIYTYDTADARLGVGADGTTLEADSGEATGLKWVDYGDGELDYADRSSTSTQAVNGTAAAIPWQTEINAGTEITWTSGANTRLVVGETGTYKLGGFFAVTSTDARAQHAVEVYINGVGTGILRGTSYIRNSGTSWDYWVIEMATEPIELTASDYVEIFIGTTTTTTYAFGTNGAASTLVGDKSRVWLERAKARGAKGDTGATGGNEKEDNVFRIIDDGDNTKKIAFQASGITTGTTRTITMPDSDITLGDAFDPGTYTGASSYHANLSGTVDSRQDDASQIYIKASISVTGTIAAGTTLFQISDTPAATRYFPITMTTGGGTYYEVSGKCDSSGNVSVVNGGVGAGYVIYFDGANFYGG